VSRATREIRQEELSFRLQDLHLLWLAIQCYSTKIILCNSLKVPGHLRPIPTTPQRQRPWPLTSLWFRHDSVSLAATQEISVDFFSSGYYDGSLPQVRPSSTKRCYTIKCNGFPHSGIPGSKLVYSSPRLFAVHRALHRLSVPRHPPYTLSTLINKFSRLYLFPANLTQQ
jgi:hypothetical protein